MRHLAVLLAVVGASAGSVVSAAAAPPTGMPPVRHVWVIVLENKNFDATFGPDSQAPYLSNELTKKGQLLTQYYGTTHLSLGNYVAMVSGQGANLLTQTDCQIYTDVFPGAVGPDGQAVGLGCVYPSAVKTVADQLQAKGLAWRGYMQDMKTPCRHPELNTRDQTQSAKPGDQYAARHNPFVYFHSIIDTPACAAYDVPLEGALEADLAMGAAAPAFSLISPDLCEDGHDAPCADGRPGGLVSADAFLREWVPRILDSAAYDDGGMVVVTFDEAEFGSTSSDVTSCCGQPPPGGGRTGAVVLSPFIRKGTVNDTPYNHYSLLRTVEDLYRLSHLGHAADSGVTAFGSDVFTRSHRRPTAPSRR